MIKMNLLSKLQEFQVLYNLKQLLFFIESSVDTKLVLW